MLPGARLGDDPLLRHAQAQQHLAQRVVDLVRARVVEVLALEPDLRLAAVVLGEALGEVERGGAADVVLEDGLELGLELRVEDLELRMKKKVLEVVSGVRFFFFSSFNVPRVHRRLFFLSCFPITFHTLNAGSACALAYSCSSSVSAAMSVSGTYFPPNAPNRPAASGRGVEAEWGFAVVVGAAAAADTAADDFDAAALGRMAFFFLALAERRGDDEDDEGCAVASTTSGDDVTRRAAIAEREKGEREDCRFFQAGQRKRDVS